MQSLLAVLFANILFAAAARRCAVITLVSVFECKQMSCDVRGPLDLASCDYLRSRYWCVFFLSIRHIVFVWFITTFPDEMFFSCFIHLLFLENVYFDILIIASLVIVFAIRYSHTCPVVHV